MWEMYFQLFYNVVSGGASGITMDMKVKGVLGDVPDTGIPYPVLFVQVKQEIDDVEGVCPEHDTTVYSDIKLDEYGMPSGDDTKL
jgi:hypothetical protein